MNTESNKHPTLADHVKDGEMTEKQARNLDPDLVEVISDPRHLKPSYTEATYHDMEGVSLQYLRLKSGVVPENPGDKKVCLNCGKEGSHFAPPSMGETGFYTCKKQDRPTPKVGETWETRRGKKATVTQIDLSCGPFPVKCEHECGLSYYVTLHGRVWERKEHICDLIKRSSTKEEEPDVCEEKDPKLCNGRVPGVTPGVPLPVEKRLDRLEMNVHRLMNPPEPMRELSAEEAAELLQKKLNPKPQHTTHMTLAKHIEKSEMMEDEAVADYKNNIIHNVKDVGIFRCSSWSTSESEYYSRERVEECLKVLKSNPENIRLKIDDDGNLPGYDLPKVWGQAMSYDEDEKRYVLIMGDGRVFKTRHATTKQGAKAYAVQDMMQGGK